MERTLKQMAAEAATLLPGVEQAQARPPGDPVRAAAEQYIAVYRDLGAQPRKWTKEHLMDSLDRFAAMSQFDAERPDFLLECFAGVPASTRLRRQVYWAWMQNDDQHLRQGKLVYRPFECRVGPSHVRYRRQYIASSIEAAEFYDLSRFIPRYFERTGRTLSFLSKSETPDFIARDISTRRDVGIEMVESTDGDRASQQRFFWELMGYLRERLAEAECVISIDANQAVDWREFCAELREPFLASAEALVRQGNNKRSIIKLGDREIWVSTRVRSGALIILQEESWIGDEPEEIACKNLLQSLRIKTSKKKEPSTSETILVLYPNNHIAAVDYEQVLERCMSEAQEIVSGERFQEVWLTKEKTLLPIKYDGPLIG